jgi:hypothetical protein
MFRDNRKRALKGSAYALRDSGVTGRIYRRSFEAVLGGSTFALLAPVLAAPFGPSAMCFLRHTRAFGWLDPSLNRVIAPPSRSHHAASLHLVGDPTPLRG